MKKKMGRPLKYEQPMTELIAFAITPKQKERVIQYMAMVEPNRTGNLGDFVRELVLGEIVRQTGIMI